MYGFKYAFRVVAGWALILSVFSCSEKERSSKVTARPVGAEVPHRLRPLYPVPDFSFIDHRSNRVQLSDLKDRVWVANFIFTRCGSTCPMQTAKLAGLQTSLQKKPWWKEVRFLSFTVDPEYDRPGVLAKYALDHQATANWHFLTGKRSVIWDFSREGLKLPVDESGLDPKMPILHSSRTVLVDGRGQVRGYYDGLDDASLEKMKEDIETLLKEPLP
ncbi:MAG: SCO family protein [Verrucomicrobiota bacterium]